MKLSGTIKRHTRSLIAAQKPSCPIYLCPALLSPLPYRPSKEQSRCFTSFFRRCTELAAQNGMHQEPASVRRATTERPLPVSCPGCGALAQTVDTDQAGYYDTSRTAVKKYLRYGKDQEAKENAVFKEAMQHADERILNQLGLASSSLGQFYPLPSATPPPPPICDRCHELTHNNAGTPIHHPSVEAIAETIAESPHKHNHIYHVLDAVDFPMSLVPNLQRQLSLSRLRTQNRRSKSHRYIRGGTAEMSFIITRSDLLAPKKEMVDKMMPYMMDVLRDALGRAGQRIRLGNLRMVSSHRGWWTKDIKETIWKCGGGGWLVGKVNVGKSQLFENVFPKGRGGQEVNVDKMRRQAAENAALSASISNVDQGINLDDYTPERDQNQEDENLDLFNETSLLPPAPKEVPFPPMPIISALPGTTASPIRLPFGDGRGELIDLPGFRRHSLEEYVKPEKRLDIIMRSRVVPERITLKPGKTLLLDGLVRIKPATANLIFLTHSFVPLHPHITDDAKIAEVEAGERAHPLENIMIADPQKIAHAGGLKSAGKIQLRWDVTKAHAGPLVRKDTVGLKPDALPFITYAADVLIEGSGWVEIVAQVRKRSWFQQQPGEEASPEAKEPERELSFEESLEIPESDERNMSWSPTSPTPSSAEMSRFPEVEIFTPEGKFIGVRKPMNAWLTGGPMKKASNARKSRPRRSMRSVKKQRSPKE
ncbi:hypothetical protein NA57DRAFT_48753 [Rhizodiscina lignyota]|uniref:Genetic interactor of prohibitins 3, mitochondrial n=1 Tax=Rhizodiscina lignyota TaxID=1504668 RepID=A0A9P4I4X4_9PEZI|nr:hypothetical protein NA57DRAFT_48753 [Rhizodiscina lignyota]